MVSHCARILLHNACSKFAIAEPNLVINLQLFAAALFSRAISLEPKSQKAFFHYAKYLDQLMQDAQKRQAARNSATSKGMDRIGGKARCRTTCNIESCHRIIQCLSIRNQHFHRLQIKYWAWTCCHVEESVNTEPKDLPAASDPFAPSQASNLKAHSNTPAKGHK